MEAVAGVVGIVSGVPAILVGIIKTGQHVRQLIREVPNLEDQFNGLGEETETILGVFHLVADNGGFLEDVGLCWGPRHLTSLLENATRAITRLETILTMLRQDRRILSGTRKYYRNKSYDPEIGTLRVRMSLYIASLQTFVAVLTLNRVSDQSSSLFQSQTEARKDIIDKIDGIEQGIERLQRCNMKAISSPDAQQMADDDRQLIEIAESLVTSSFRGLSSRASTISVLSFASHPKPRGPSYLPELQGSEAPSNMLQPMGRPTVGRLRDIMDWRESVIIDSEKGASQVDNTTQAPSTHSIRRRPRRSVASDSSRSSSDRTSNQEPGIRTSSSIITTTTIPELSSSEGIQLKTELCQRQFNDAIEFISRENYPRAITHLKYLMEKALMPEKETEIVQALAKAYELSEPLGQDATDTSRQFPQLNNALCKMVFSEGVRSADTGDAKKAKEYLLWVLEGLERCNATDKDEGNVRVEWRDKCKLRYVECLEESESKEAEELLLQVWGAVDAQSLDRLRAAAQLSRIYFVRADNWFEKARWFAEKAATGLYREIGHSADETVSAIWMLVNVCFEMQDPMADIWIQKIEGDLSKIAGMDRKGKFRATMLRMQRLYDYQKEEEAGQLLKALLERDYEYSLGWIRISLCMDCIALNSHVILNVPYRQPRGCSHQHRGAYPGAYFTALHFLAASSPKDSRGESCASELSDILKMRRGQLNLMDDYPNHALRCLGELQQVSEAPCIILAGDVNPIQPEVEVEIVSANPLSMAALSGAGDVMSFFLSMPSTKTLDNDLASCVLDTVRWNESAEWWRLSEKQTSCIDSLVARMRQSDLESYLKKGNTPTSPQILNSVLTALCQGNMKRKTASTLLLEVVLDKRKEYTWQLWLCVVKEMVKILLDHGADPSTKDEYGNTALHNLARRTALLDLVPKVEVGWTVRQIISSDQPITERVRAARKIFHPDRPKAEAISPEICAIISEFKARGVRFNLRNRLSRLPYEYAKTRLVRDALFVSKYDR
ncbi:Fc.00g108580.m01.CDS01 [Cosmosporella sp. VM-42]